MTSHSAEYYEGRLRINRNKLDDELSDQPQLFWEVSEAFADCVRVRDGFKAALAELWAQLSLDQRLAMDAEGLKVTEKAIDARVQTNPKRVVREHQYLEAKAQADWWGAMKEAFTQRSYALKDMVALYIAGYFGDVTPKRTGSQLSDQQHEERKTVMAEQRQDRKPRQRLAVGRDHLIKG